MPGDDSDVEGQYKVTLSETAQQENTFKFIDTSHDHVIQNPGGQIRNGEGTELLTDMDNGELYYPELPEGSGFESSGLKSSASEPSSSEPGSHTEPGNPAEKIVQLPQPDIILDTEDGPTSMGQEKQTKKKQKLKGPRSKRVSPADLLLENGEPFVDLETNPEMRDYVEDLEAEKRFVMSEVNMTFPQAMKESPLSSAVPYSLRVLYRSWRFSLSSIASKTGPPQLSGGAPECRAPIDGKICADFGSAFVPLVPGCPWPQCSKHCPAPFPPRFPPPEGNPGPGVPQRPPANLRHARQLAELR